jgi:hypothetical protein
MPIHLPFVVGGLVLTAVGLGVKRVLREVGAPRLPEEHLRHEARARHREAVEALLAARRRLGERVRGASGLRRRALTEGVWPFEELLARLERWEHAREADVLTPEAREALRRLPRPGQRPRGESLEALWGLGAPPPPALLGALGWLEGGWLRAAQPAVLEGVPLFQTVEVERVAQGSLEDVARALDAATGALQRVTRLLDTLGERLERRDAQVAPLHARVSAQLAYLDAGSFEGAGAEPRERLLRLGQLVGELLLLLGASLLDAEGRLVPPPGEPGSPP